MIASVVVILDEGIDLLPEITWQVIVFQQDAVLQGLVPTFDLALSLRVIWRTTDVIHVLTFCLTSAPMGQFRVI